MLQHLQFRHMATRVESQRLQQRSARSLAGMQQMNLHISCCRSARFRINPELIRVKTADVGLKLHDDFHYTKLV